MQREQRGSRRLCGQRPGAPRPCPGLRFLLAPCGGRSSPWSSKMPAVTFSSRGRYSSPSLSTHQACVLSHFSCVQLFATLWTTHQAPLSMGFPRQEYWSGLSFPPPGDLPDPGMEPASLMSPALAGGFFFTTSATWEAPPKSRPL